jgi:uncharacterized membrane protein YfcA
VACRREAGILLLPLRIEANLYAAFTSDVTARGFERRKVRASMLLAIAILFLIGWLVGFIAFHVTVFFIHILLVLFVIFLILHFVRRPRT